MYDNNRQKTMEIYWLKRLSEDLPGISLPRMPDVSKKDIEEITEENIRIPIPAKTVDRLTAISKGSNQGMFVLFLSGLNLVLHTYTGVEDIVIGTVNPRQEEDIQDKLLLIRNQAFSYLSFKELIGQVKENVKNDFNHWDYSFGYLYQRLLNQKKQNQGNDSADSIDEKLDIFNIAFIYDQFQNRSKLLEQFDVVLVLSRQQEGLVLEIDNVTDQYSRDILVRFGNNLIDVMEHIDENLNRSISAISIVSPKEKIELARGNPPLKQYPENETIQQLFQEQAARTPDCVAVLGTWSRANGENVSDKKADSTTEYELHLTYGLLNEKSDLLARLLHEKGFKPGNIAGLMLERSIGMVIAMLGVLKAGGAYLPIDIHTPTHRVNVMLNDSNASMVITQSKNNIFEIHSYTSLRGLDFTSAIIETERNKSINITPPCERISDFDQMPFPNRSLIDNEKYNRLIGQSLIKNRIVIQASRGCPHNCAYCYRIWPRKQVARTAENIFKEIKMYYDQGIKKFDIFMLNIKQGRRLFEIIIEKQITDLQLYFPNGFRGDLIDKEYVDLMVKAGTVNFALALETASPRLQKLINKHLELKRFRETAEYTCKTYPNVVLELFTLHGIPSETEEEAKMTLEFIKSLKWVHFPYVNVLKIYRHTEMEKVALNAGISREAIFRSENLAWHEWSETLPFNRSFTSRYQSDFLNNYVLSKERLLQTVPHQMKILTEEEFLDKYDSYLPGDITTFEDFLSFTGLTQEELNGNSFCDEKKDELVLKGLNDRIRSCFPVHKPSPDAFRVLLLDLTQFFSDHADILYDVVDPPLGLMYILTYLNQQLGEKVDGKILKARLDFDSYGELKKIIDEFKPQVIGVRSLSYYKDFFHLTIANIRDWGFTGPIVAGGPYATVDYETLLQDRNINLAVLGEGENTFLEIIKRTIDNSGALPDRESLEQINGIAFNTSNLEHRYDREIVFVDTPGNSRHISTSKDTNLTCSMTSSDLAYIIYTSGSTGTPKGVAVSHRNVVNVLKWFGETYSIQTDTHVMQMSNYTFDPSVEQIFGTLLHGGALYLANREIIGNRELFQTFVEKHLIHVVNFVPGALKELLTGDKRLMSLRAVIPGGEKLEETVKQKLLEIGYTIYNHYGPTETTIDALMKRCTSEPVTLGNPISNVQCYILLFDGVLAPIGVSGELFIGGAGVTPGYLNNPELTSQKFYTLIEEEGFNNHSSKYGSPVLIRELSPSDSHRLYRTGDLARRLLNLEIEFIGRKDHQVKVRGLRIELGEIETQLLRCPGISETVVITRKSETGDNYLCAYAVRTRETGDQLKTIDLKNFLSAQLPEYMIPPHIVLMDTFPRTSSGKIDRHALPEPTEFGDDKKKEYIAPRDETETALAHVWETVLNRKPVGIDENFFAIGGDSIKSIQIVSRLKSAGYHLEMNNLFKHPTVAELAPLVKKVEPVSTSPASAELGDSASLQDGSSQVNRSVERDFIYMEHVSNLSQEILSEFSKRVEGEIEDIYPLSPMQEGMLIHFLYEKSTTAYFEQRSYRLQGKVPLDIEVVEKSLNELIRRHDILRTVFIHDVSERPMQVVLKEQRIPLIYIPLTQLDVPVNEIDAVEMYVKEFKEKDRQKTFDLSKDVLMRVTIIQTNETEYEFLWSHHHILMDGWCASILISEFFEIQRYFLKNQVPQLPNPAPYKIYIKWLEDRDRKESKNYWRNYLADYGEMATISVLNLQNSSHRDNKTFREGYKNEDVILVLDKNKTKNLKSLAAENHVTLNTVMQTLWGVLLGTICGRPDVVFGVVVSGRPPEVRHIETMVGLFINTVPVRIQFHSNPTFGKLLLDVQKQALESEPFHFFPLADIQSISQLKQNLMDHIFIFENTPKDRDFRDIYLEDESIGDTKNIPAGKEENENVFEFSGYDAFDQTNYSFNLVLYPGDELVVRFQYDGNVYEKESIEWLAEHLELAVQHVLENEKTTIGQLSLLTSVEKKRVLEEFNNTVYDFPVGKTLHELFADQVEKTPTRLALYNIQLDVLSSVTYLELNERSNRLANLLRMNGILNDQTVGIMVERSIEMIVGIWGVLKAGGAYLPIDPNYPEERINYMLKDSCSRYLLTKNSIQSNKNIDSSIQIIDFLDSSIEAYDSSNPKNINSPNDLVHAIYTSGSTGKPKGVLLSHFNVVNFIYDLYHNYYKQYLEKGSIEKKEYLNFGLIAPYVFAGSVKQIFSAQLFGHSLHIVPEEGRFNGDLLIDFFNQKEIDITDATPAHLRLITEAYRKKSEKHCKLRHFNISAEILPKGLVNEFFELVQGEKPHLANLYGPTECCVDATGYMINMNEIEWLNSIPIGNPLGNVHIYILNQWGELSLPGVFGELCIGGDGVSRGYMNRPELTAEKFIGFNVNQNNSKIGLSRASKVHEFTRNNIFGIERIYNTGDLARWLPNGNLEFLGRADRQLNIRGLRVEPGEIENTLKKYPGIKNCIIHATPVNGEIQLIAYYIPNQDMFRNEESVDFTGTSEKGEQFSSAALREFLNKSLPPYMIPSYFIILKTIPLTPSGKIDYQSLPEPQGKNQKKKAQLRPSNETEEKILQIWSDVLEIEPNKFGVEDDFFELGGNSITILNVLSRMKKVFNQEIPFSSLFLYPTIRSLSINIKEEQTLSQLECVVRLNRARNKRNLFIIHPMHGMIYQYRDLALLLEDQFAVFGIQARGLVRRTPIAESMEIMVADYIHQIRQVQADGPYLIAAHCFGDILSYNMVKEMELMGLKVERLIMLDEPAFIQEWTTWRFKVLEMAKNLCKPFFWIGKQSKKILRIESLTTHEKILNELKAKLPTETAEALLSPEEAQERKIKVHRNIKRLDQVYWGTHPFQRLKGIIRAPLLVIKAKDRRNPRFAMKALKNMTYSKDIVLVESPGTHHTLFNKSNIQTLAKVLREALMQNSITTNKE